MLSTAPYLELKAGWPKAGKHILATYDDKTIIVYQAFNEQIAAFAATNQTFIGCPGYSMSRMTWVKTNFMWMMYRCGWCKKDSDQSHVLAIRLTFDGFEELLRRAVNSRARREEISNSEVRLQWDPDHSPCGGKMERRAVQLGIRGQTLDAMLHKWVVSIEDVTASLVTPQWPVVFSGEESESWMARVVSPVERVYLPQDRMLWDHIELDVPQNAALPATDRCEDKDEE